MSLAIRAVRVHASCVGEPNFRVAQASPPRPRLRHPKWHAATRLRTLTPLILDSSGAAKTQPSKFWTQPSEACRRIHTALASTSTSTSKQLATAGALYGRYVCQPDLSLVTPLYDVILLVTRSHTLRLYHPRLTNGSEARMPLSRSETMSA